MALVYIYQLAKFGDLIELWFKRYIQKCTVSCANTHYGLTDLVNHGKVKNTKTWISWERNITFLQNKKILNLCLRWNVLRSYRFVVEVTFNMDSETETFVTLPPPALGEKLVFRIHNNGSFNSLNFAGARILLHMILRIILLHTVCWRFAMVRISDWSRLEHPERIKCDI